MSAECVRAGDCGEPSSGSRRGAAGAMTQGRRSGYASGSFFATVKHLENRAKPLCRIRRARPEELEDIVRLQATVHAEFYAPPDVDTDKYLANSLVCARAPSWVFRTYLVAEVAGRLAGIAQARWNTIAALYVARAYRSQGIGSALLAAAEAALRDRGVGLASLRVAQGNPAVRAFYERHGWRSGAPMHDPIWGVPLLGMTKEINAFDTRRHAAIGALFKSALVVACTPFILPAVVALWAMGALRVSESLVAGLVLGYFTISMIVRLDCVNFANRRNGRDLAAAAGTPVGILAATVAIGAAALWSVDAPVFQHRDREALSFAVLFLLALAADQVARRAVEWLTKRRGWLLA
jgi:GNAT superfamily N-acetyltransferase